MCYLVGVCVVYVCLGGGLVGDGGLVSPSSRLCGCMVLVFCLVFSPSFALRCSRPFYCYPLLIFFFFLRIPFVKF